mgnify:CR=1 FL=1
MKEDVALPRRIFEGRENIGFHFRTLPDTKVPICTATKPRTYTILPRYMST